LRQDSFADLAQDNLDALSKRFGVTAIGVEASGLGHMIVVAIARPAQPFRLHVDVGSRFPALISASGRCIAAADLPPRVTRPPRVPRRARVRELAASELRATRAAAHAATRLGSRPS